MIRLVLAILKHIDNDCVYMSRLVLAILKPTDSESG